jgi:putative addiction module component (TIGR02574 family)
MTTLTLEREALKLPVAKRVRLAEKLMASVDYSTPAVEAAWKKEIARRAKEFDDGTEPGIPAEEVHAMVRRKLREARRVSPAGRA